MVASEDFFDTSILIDYMNGIEASKGEIQKPSKAISVITWMEVMAGIEPTEELRTRVFLRRFRVVPLSDEIMEQAVVIRRERGLKLPDAIILATAINSGLRLVTRNTKDFKASDPPIRIPYRL